MISTGEDCREGGVSRKTARCDVIVQAGLEEVRCPKTLSFTLMNICDAQ